MTENELYSLVTAALHDIFVEIHAVYEPDGSEYLGDCYCVAVDLFKQGMTFRIYFKLEENKINVENVERWHFG